MPENVRYISYCSAHSKLLHKSFGHTVLGPTGVNLCMVLYLTFRGMYSCITVKQFKTSFIVHDGTVLTMVIVCHFELYMCVNGSPVI